MSESKIPPVPDHITKQAFTALSNSGDARSVKNHNRNYHYFLMKNPHGREVPIKADVVGEALNRGFIHIDGVMKYDNPEDQVQPPTQSSDPMTVLAEALKQLSESNVEQKEVNKLIKETFKKDKK